MATSERPRDHQRSCAAIGLFNFHILAGSRLLRGEEGRGTMDVLLATPQPRVRLLLEKIAALALALILIALLFVLGAVAGEARLGGGHVALPAALLTGLNLSLLAFLFGMLALLLLIGLVQFRSADIKLG